MAAGLGSVPGPTSAPAPGHDHDRAVISAPAQSSSDQTSAQDSPPDATSASLSTTPTPAVPHPRRTTWTRRLSDSPRALLGAMYAVHRPPHLHIDGDGTPSEPADDRDDASVRAMSFTSANSAYGVPGSPYTRAGLLSSRSYAAAPHTPPAHPHPPAHTSHPASPLASTSARAPPHAASSASSPARSPTYTLSPPPPSTAPSPRFPSSADIRASTMQLSSLPGSHAHGHAFPHSLSRDGRGFPALGLPHDAYDDYEEHATKDSAHAYIFPADPSPLSAPAPLPAAASSPPSRASTLASDVTAPGTGSDSRQSSLSAASSAALSALSLATTPTGAAGAPRPSGLSLLIARERKPSVPDGATLPAASRTAAPADSSADRDGPTPTAERPDPTSVLRSESRSSLGLDIDLRATEEPLRVWLGPLVNGPGDAHAQVQVHAQAHDRHPHNGHENGHAPPASETTALLSGADPEHGAYGPKRHALAKAPARTAARAWAAAEALYADVGAGVQGVDVAGAAGTALRSLPAVLLGALLNVLDGVSYGMIIFPAAGVFADMGLGPVGVSMFFVSAIVSQLVYSAGGSGFAGANGSMMIEVVPFFHILATRIAEEIGPDRPQEVLSTTLVAFALSSVLTGLSFFLLGALRLGSLIGFFPRHILVGCIGGVGLFLIITGFTVSTRLDDDEFGFSLEVLKFFLTPHTLALWVPALGLAVLLRVITHRWTHQLVFPMYFLVIPALFYAVVGAARLDLGALRRDGWLFDMGETSEAWWKFYTYFDWKATQFAPLWHTMPTQLALLFFNILHPPLNVPALAVSLDLDVDTNKELVGHGYSNLLAGLVGTVPNYLVYVNTLLFYRVGGTTRIAGFMLAGATVVLLLVGTGPIAYIPVMVVGALIFVLGIDLVKEALWDCRHRVSRLEYITIASIMLAMTAWDFVIGVLFGIVVSCFFFVVQNSQTRSIRALHTGETAMSTVRRPSAHRAYLREVSKQTTILKLQGFLFFGTITNVEETIRTIVDGASWARNPVRFLVVDFALVAGVDMSAAEAFVRIQRLLATKQVILCFCGFYEESPVGVALSSVGLLDTDGVELFSTLHDAMEWTENAYLRTWFMSQKTETSEPMILPGRQDTDLGLHQSLSSTPRRSHIRDAGWRTIARDTTTSPVRGTHLEPEPFNTLQRAFSSYGPVDRTLFQPLLALLERLELPEGHVVFSQGDRPDGLYIIQAGVLRASYRFADYTPGIEESMVPGTLAGELSALSGEQRNATVVVERHAIVWRLSAEKLVEVEREHAEAAWAFVKLVLKAAKVDNDILLSALATRQ